MTGARAAQACIDRFHGKAYDPASRRDCARLAAHRLHLAGVAVPPMKKQTYRTEAGALRALRRTGFAGLVAAVDTLGLERIAPLRAMPGDIVALPHETFGAALTVVVGNGRVLGFQDGVCRIVQPHVTLAAWRVPCPR